MNQLVLEASVIEREAIRYTPAGIPVVNCLLQHGSRVTEAGVPRQVDLTLSAVGIGELSGALAACTLGQAFRFTGFLAPRRRQARTLIFHITELQNIQRI
ncbi:primosomal replication protein N [Mycoavidus sp. B2-EB]|uniref:primosomal replication protein N n=1 Tax=Mycoavidus sp. B2-EB TaxID=2651972 RepID=UPI001623DD2F|nr:primosomal replication protein N [Mycoavidus sp. B2-EB]BBO59409.1 primosomal replication protein N [Mycoavidus sp. B2-EB]